MSCCMIFEMVKHTLEAAHTHYFRCSEHNCDKGKQKMCEQFLKTIFLRLFYNNYVFAINPISAKTTT